MQKQQQICTVSCIYKAIYRKLVDKRVFCLKYCLHLFCIHVCKCNISVTQRVPICCIMNEHYFQLFSNTQSPVVHQCLFERSLPVYSILVCARCNRNKRKKNRILLTSHTALIVCCTMLLYVDLYLSFQYHFLYYFCFLCVFSL